MKKIILLLALVLIFGVTSVSIAEWGKWHERKWVKFATVQGTTMGSPEPKAVYFDANGITSSDVDGGIHNPGLHFTLVYVVIKCDEFAIANGHPFAGLTDREKESAPLGSSYDMAATVTVSFIYPWMTYAVESVGSGLPKRPIPKGSIFEMLYRILLEKGYVKVNPLIN